MSGTVNGVDNNNSNAPIFLSSPSRRPAADATHNFNIVFKIMAVGI
jgi:hypothetical protein